MMGKCEISIWQPGILAQRILVDTTGKNTQKTAGHIRKQLKEDGKADYGPCAVYGESDNLRLVEI